MRDPTINPTPTAFQQASARANLDLAFQTPSNQRNSNPPRPERTPTSGAIPRRLNEERTDASQTPAKPTQIILNTPRSNGPTYAEVAISPAKTGKRDTYTPLKCNNDDATKKKPKIRNKQNRTPAAIRKAKANQAKNTTNQPANAQKKKRKNKNRGNKRRQNAMIKRLTDDTT